MCICVRSGRCLFVSLSVYFCARVCLNLVRLQLSVSCLCKTVRTDSVCLRVCLFVVRVFICMCFCECLYQLPCPSQSALIFVFAVFVSLSVSVGYGCVFLYLCPCSCSVPVLILNPDKVAAHDTYSFDARSQKRDSQT